MPDEPLRHILRTALPWRDTDTLHTVCGRPSSQYAPELVLTFDEARREAKRLGRQRTAMLFCMTCANRAGTWAKWDDDPVARMARECEKYGAMGRGKDTSLVERELRAIGLLIEAHREEFDQLVADLAGVTTMAELRQRRTLRRYSEGGQR